MRDVDLVVIVCEDVFNFSLRFFLEGFFANARRREGRGDRGV